MSRLPSRLLALLIALLLPLQFAWAASAVYCQHEPATQLTRHFGHHAHEHVHDGGAAESPKAKVALDADCGFCNTAVPHALTYARPAFTKPLPAARLPDRRAVAMNSALARAPDRPQWRRLA